MLRRWVPTVAWEQSRNLEGMVRAMDRIDPAWTDQWKQEGLKEGLEKGLEKGLQQGRAETQREALAKNRALLTR